MKNLGVKGIGRVLPLHPLGARMRRGVGGPGRGVGDPGRGTGGPAHGTRRAAAVLAAIHALRRTFTEFQRQLAAASGDAVSGADAFALQFIAHAGDTTPGDIAAFTGLTSGSVTTLLDRLEAAGFVTRSRSTKDRRVVTVQLVPGARQRVMAMMLEAHQGVGRMFDGWKVGEVEQLVALLERMRPPSA